MNTTNACRVDECLEASLASSPVVHYGLPADGDRRRLSWISEQVASLLGYPSAVCLAPDWWEDGIHPEDRRSMLARTAAPLRDTRLVCEYRLRRSDGSYCWVRDELQRPVTNGEPAPFCVGVLMDITDHKRIEQALTDTASQFRAMVEQSVQAIAITQAGRIQFANLACIRLFGYTRSDEVVGQAWDAFSTPEDQPKLRERIEACLRGEAVPPHPGWQGIRQDGTRVWVESVGNRFTWQGRPAVLSFLTDATDRMKLEAQYRQAQKMEAIGQLAGGVAHDFNNLLTVINGYSEILLASMDADDPKRDIVAELQHAGGRATALTRQLLVVSRKQNITPRVLDLNAHLQDLELLLARTIGEDIQLGIALHATDPVLADPSQLDQILLNLAINARDAMPRGGKLTIETRNICLDDTYTRLRPGVAPGPYVLLAVSDTGCGMTPEVQTHIFEPFFTTKGPHEGTGLGLATVYGIVKQSGGHIGLYSEPGQGTTFRIYLPCAHAGERATERAACAVPPPGGHETVLVVEDEPAVRNLLRQVLLANGYQVLEAANGHDGLAICHEHAGLIDLLITDVVMPQMDGQELAHAAMIILPALRVLFLSGYTEEAIVRHGVLSENVQFLGKPFVGSELARKVREVLDEPAHTE
jgi:PAS domain S-box-containing protein